MTNTVQLDHMNLQASTGFAMGGQATLLQGKMANGVQVFVSKNEPSMLAANLLGPDSEALEEIGQFLSNKMDAKKARDVKTANRTNKAQIATVNQVLNFLNQMRRPYNLPQFEGMIRNFLKSRYTSASNLKDRLEREFSDDDAEQYMFLQAMIAYGRDSGDSHQDHPSQNENLALQLLDEIEDKRGDGLFAEINAAKEGFSYGKTPEEVRKFCSNYGHMVMDCNTLGEVLESVFQLLPQFDEQKEKKEAIIHHYSQVFDRLISTAGFDMNTLRPSRDTVQLRQLVKNLFLLQALKTVFENCIDEASRLEKSIEPIIKFKVLVSPNKLMCDLVAISGDRMVSVARFINMPMQYGVTEVQAKVLFVKMVQRLLKEMTDNQKVFVSKEARLDILNALQEGLDELIADEEENTFEVDEDIDLDFLTPISKSTPHSK